MKKIVIILTLILATTVAMANEVAPVNPVVLQSFKKNFSTATEVSWSASGEVYIADFQMSCQYIKAYYSCSGELLGLKKNILSSQLPIFLEAGLKEQYKNYWISDLAEFANQDGTAYYVTIENADERIVLKSYLNNWMVFHKGQK